MELTLTGDRMTEATGALCRLVNIPGAVAPEEDANVKVEVLAADAKKARLRLTALAQAEHFDLVMTDLRLPGMSGLDLLRAVREADAAVPVIVLTAYGTVRWWKAPGAADSFRDLEPVMNFWDRWS